LEGGPKTIGREKKYPQPQGKKDRTAATEPGTGKNNFARPSGRETSSPQADDDEN